MYASSGTVMQKAKVTGEQVMSLLAPHRPGSDPQESDRGVTSLWVFTVGHIHV